MLIFLECNGGHRLLHELGSDERKKGGSFFERKGE